MKRAIPDSLLDCISDTESSLNNDGLAAAAHDNSLFPGPAPPTGVGPAGVPGSRRLRSERCRWSDRQRLPRHHTSVGQPGKSEENK